ncbi:MAG: hypothetical protein ACFWT6_03035 [Virgibacillus proomii]
MSVLVLLRSGQFLSENGDTVRVYIRYIKKLEDKNNRCIRSTYRILLHQVNVGNLVIITPNKLTYESQQLESNETVDSDKVQEITELLESPFVLSYSH